MPWIGAAYGPEPSQDEVAFRDLLWAVEHDDDLAIAARWEKDPGLSHYAPAQPWLPRVQLALQRASLIGGLYPGAPHLQSDQIESSFDPALLRGSWNLTVSSRLQVSLTARAMKSVQRVRSALENGDQTELYAAFDRFLAERAGLFDESETVKIGAVIARCKADLVRWEQLLLE